jgi:hypothetical protein
MTSEYIKYLKQILIFAGIISFITLVAAFTLPKPYLSPALPFLIPFFIATSLISFYYLHRSLTRRYIRFVNTFLLSIIIKLFLYIVVMIVYLILNRQDAIPFLIGFFVYYLCFTIFESVCIIRVTHPSPGK